MRLFPLFSPLADHSLLVEFGETIDHAIHAEVIRLDQAVAAQPFCGFVEAVPAYASILLRFNPLLTDHIEVEAAVRHLLETARGREVATCLRDVHICYDEEFAPDLSAVAQMLGLTPETVISAHLSGDYDVFMYGFAPGYAYLAGVPDHIRLPRKPAAVRAVAAGSVLIAGPQCLVSTITMPTGWWIIGRSPTPILTGDAARPFLFDVGDKVQFRRMSRAEYDREVGQ